MVYLYITLLAVLFYPVIAMNLDPFGRGTWYGLALGMSLFVLGTVSATIFYIASQRAQKRSVLGTIAQVPLLMAIGVGIALNNAIACIEALVGHESPFVRTPKYNTAPAPGSSSTDSSSGLTKIIPIPSMKRTVCLLELALGVYMLACIWLSLHTGHTAVSLPFLCLFAAGYFYVGSTSLWVHLRGHMESRRPPTIPQPV
ncbi:MAG: hypothetical protein R3C45_06145 [Phycisphaerales bacterium]